MLVLRYQAFNLIRQNCFFVYMRLISDAQIQPQIKLVRGQTSITFKSIEDPKFQNTMQFMPGIRKSEVIMNKNMLKYASETATGGLIDGIIQYFFLVFISLTTTPHLFLSMPAMKLTVREELCLVSRFLMMVD